MTNIVLGYNNVDIDGTTFLIGPLNGGFKFITSDDFKLTVKMFKLIKKLDFADNRIVKWTVNVGKYKYTPLEFIKTEAGWVIKND